MLGGGEGAHLDLVVVGLDRVDDVFVLAVPARDLGADQGMGALDLVRERLADRAEVEGGGRRDCCPGVAIGKAVRGAEHLPALACDQDDAAEAIAEGDVVQPRAEAGRNLGVGHGRGDRR